MANLLLENETEQSLKARIVHFGERAIPFERFLDMAEGRFVELEQGVIVEMPNVDLDHVLCCGWISQVIGIYAEKRKAGLLLNSRIMVKTDDFGGRMPDLLFVKQERMRIVQQRSVYGAPDLVIKIISPNDRPSHLRELKAEYFGLGVPELVFINLRKKEIRLMRLNPGGYQEIVITEGEVRFEAIPNLVLQAEWILNEPRPDVFDTLSDMFSC